MPVLGWPAVRGADATMHAVASPSATPGRRVYVVARGARYRLHVFSTSMPGEDAPGTGRRQFPAPVEKEGGPGSDGGDAGNSKQPRTFDMMTTEQCYREFPTHIRADNLDEAMPILEQVAKKDPVPGGVALMEQATDLGPTFGKRHPPSPYETPVGKNLSLEEQEDARHALHDQSRRRH